MKLKTKKGYITLVKYRAYADENGLITKSDMMEMARSKESVAYIDFEMDQHYLYSLLIYNFLFSFNEKLDLNVISVGYTTFDYTDLLINLVDDLSYKNSYIYIHYLQVISRDIKTIIRKLSKISTKRNISIILEIHESRGYIQDFDLKRVWENDKYGFLKLSEYSNLIIPIFIDRDGAIKDGISEAGYSTKDYHLYEFDENGTANEYLFLKNFK